MTIELETTDQAWAALAKAKRPKLEWTQADKSNWHAEVDGERLPARIRMLDAKTYAVYRDGKYLGGEPTLEQAKKRVDLNCVSERNRVVRLWEQTHPGELPPGLQLTAAERALFWERNPPKAAPRMAATGGRGVGKPAKPVADAAEAKVKEPVAKRAAPSGNRDAEILVLLKRGCTSEEVLRVTGWKAISMPAMAKKLGVQLRIEKGTKPFKYYAEEK